MDSVLDMVTGCRRHVNTAHADVWEYVAFFCTASASQMAAGERVVAGLAQLSAWSYGGPGTPVVPTEAVTELGVELGESREAAARLVGISMNLLHRLPRVLAAAMSGEVDWRRAEMVAWATIQHEPAVVARVQDVLVPEDLEASASLLARITKRRLVEVLEQAAIVEDPEGAEDDVEAALATRDVAFGRDERGIATMEASLDVADGARLAQRVRQVAQWLRRAGDDRSIGVRRSVALGILADPARLQALRDQVADLGPAEEPEVHAQVPGTVLFVHHDAPTDTWSLDGASGSDPCAGPLTPAQAAQIVGHDAVTVTPVIDLGTELTSTSYAAPASMKRQLALRNHGRCAFPWCTRTALTAPGTAAEADYDHAVDWPEGPTTSSNGGLYCRLHHNTKTHHGWKVEQPAPGAWVWASPTGRHHLVTAGTTTALGP